MVSDNELLNLLVQLREQYVQGDYRSLYSVWEKYGYFVEDDEESEAPPIPDERSLGKSIIEQFSNMLEGLGRVIMPKGTYRTEVRKRSKERMITTLSPLV